MYPEKYLEDLEDSKTRKSFVRRVYLVIGFLFSAFILGGLIHELGHLSVANAYGCEPQFDLGVSLFTGIHGIIESSCSMSAFGLFFFYISGYLATSAAALIALIEGKKMEKFKGRFLRALSGGLFISLMISADRSGDIANIASYLNYPLLGDFIYVSLLFLGASGSFYAISRDS